MSGGRLMRIMLLATIIVALGLAVPAIAQLMTLGIGSSGTGGAAPVTNFLLLEDGSSRLLLEDGSSKLCLESGC